MVVRSAGLLMYRRTPWLQVFLVHPGGPFYANRRAGVWSVPKGMIEDGEDELAAAVREFTEETGIAVEGPFTPLGQVAYSNGKQVLVWAVEHDCPEPCVVVSNTFALEWPPRSGQLQEFPEADDGRYFGLDEARTAILPAQAPFLDRLVQLLARQDGAT